MCRSDTFRVDNDPAPSFLTQAYSQAEAWLGVRGQLICFPAEKQGGCVSDIFACGNVQPNDLECAAALQPVKERRPGLTVTIDAADLDRWGDIEHQHVLRMARDCTLNIQIAY